jgi:pimeloyl-ACP methyl ester carboxylesterase
LSAERLVCPGCERSYPAEDRFCEPCAMPLVHAPGMELQSSRKRARARKIKPQYAEGKLVKVARAQSQPEAEFIEGLLLEEGIPSMIQRSAGIDVPDLLAAGARDVLVPASGADAAREALAFDQDA